MHRVLALFGPGHAIESRQRQTRGCVHRPGDGDPTHRIMTTKSDLLTSSPRTAKRSSQKSEQFSSLPLSTRYYGNSGSKFPKKIRLLPSTGAGVRRGDQCPASEAGCVIAPAREILFPAPRGGRPTMFGGLILGVFVVGHRRLTPVQLRDLRIGVLGGKVKSVILRKRR